MRVKQFSNQDDINKNENNNKTKKVTQSDTKELRLDNESKSNESKDKTNWHRGRAID